MKQIKILVLIFINILVCVMPNAVNAHAREFGYLYMVALNAHCTDIAGDIYKFHHNQSIIGQMKNGDMKSVEAYSDFIKKTVKKCKKSGVGAKDSKGLLMNLISIFNIVPDICIDGKSQKLAESVISYKSRYKIQYEELSKKISLFHPECDSCCNKLYSLPFMLGQLPNIDESDSEQDDHVQGEMEDSVKTLLATQITKYDGNILTLLKTIFSDLGDLDSQRMKAIMTKVNDQIESDRLIIQDILHIQEKIMHPSVFKQYFNMAVKWIGYVTLATTVVDIVADIAQFKSVAVINSFNNITKRISINSDYFYTNLQYIYGNVTKLIDDFSIRVTNHYSSILGVTLQKNLVDSAAQSSIELNKIVDKTGDIFMGYDNSLLSIGAKIGVLIHSVDVFYKWVENYNILDAIKALNEKSVDLQKNLTQFNKDSASTITSIEKYSVSIYDTDKTLQDSNNSIEEILDNLGELSDFFIQNKIIDTLNMIPGLMSSVETVVDYSHTSRLLMQDLASNTGIQALAGSTDTVESDLKKQYVKLYADVSTFNNVFDTFDVIKRCISSDFVSNLVVMVKDASEVYNLVHNLSSFISAIGSDHERVKNIANINFYWINTVLEAFNFVMNKFYGGANSIIMKAFDDISQDLSDSSQIISDISSDGDQVKNALIKDNDACNGQSDNTVDCLIGIASKSVVSVQDSINDAILNIKAAFVDESIKSFALSQCQKIFVSDPGKCLVFQ